MVLLRIDPSNQNFRELNPMAGTNRIPKPKLQAVAGLVPRQHKQNDTNNTENVRFKNTLNGGRFTLLKGSGSIFVVNYNAVF